MAKRYELSENAWTVVADLFTDGQRKGRPRLRLCLKFRETELPYPESRNSVIFSAIYGKEFCDGQALRTFR